ncbi:unnamed protein product [Rotaria sordida]|uniref:Uncharacterized protein n=2 Tax=Rotaria sordida TaxID=392033 RepID=A0A819WLT3_9BILA|nr:unnamed protein product [Rotaria sordida]
MTLPNLIHITLSLYDIDFDEFKQFIIQISSQLKCLSVTIQYLSFCYIDVINDDFEINPYHALINRFTSSFWIQRQWIFRILVADDEVIYVIRPYRDTSNDFPKYTHFNQNSINDDIIVNQQTSVSYSSNVWLIITCLDICCSQLYASILIKIFNLLPNINSMRISLLPLPKEMYEYDEFTIIHKILLQDNKITNVTLRNISELEQIDLIIDICPWIQYLTLERISDVDLKLVVRRTLLKIKKNHIRRPITICIYVVDANNNMIQQLEKMINSKKLLKNCTLNRQYDRFYLQWRKISF